MHRLPRKYAPLTRAGGTGGRNLTEDEGMSRAGEVEGVRMPCTHQGGPPRRGGEGIGLHLVHKEGRGGGKRHRRLDWGRGMESVISGVDSKKEDTLLISCKKPRYLKGVGGGYCGE